jgi:putative methylase
MSNAPLITKKKQLEMVLQSIPYHEQPKVSLEQYKTPAAIAADLLWNAYIFGDIFCKDVVDLGCGTGIFTIGAALLGAKKSIGVDIDRDQIKIAQFQSSIFNVNSKTEFISLEIQNFNENADTVIQNPPFGAQKANKNADRYFIEKSIDIASVIYSFHLKDTEEFVENFFKSLDCTVTHKFYYKFPIPRIHDFHEKDIFDLDVVVLRVIKIK